MNILEFSGYENGSGNMGSRDLMKLRTEAVKASAENKTAMLIRSIVRESGADLSKLRDMAGFGKDPVRFDAVLAGVEELSKSEIHAMGKALATLCGEGRPDSGTVSPAEWVIFTDGGFCAETEVGSWAFIVTKNGKEVFHDHGTEKNTTSHEMETEAMLRAVKKIHEEKILSATFVSDNRTLIDVINGGKLTPDGWYRGSSCSSLQERYGELAPFIRSNRGFVFKWTRSHMGDPWNESCHALCAYELWKGRQTYGAENGDEKEFVIYTYGVKMSQISGKGAWAFLVYGNGDEVCRKAMLHDADSDQELEVRAVLEAVNHALSEYPSARTKIFTPNKYLADLVRDRVVPVKTNTPVKMLAGLVEAKFAEHPEITLEWERNCEDTDLIEKCRKICVDVFRGDCL